MKETIDRLLELVSPESRDGLQLLTAAVVIGLLLGFFQSFLAPIPLVEQALVQVGLIALACFVLK